jgi:mRNA interferase HicA
LYNSRKYSTFAEYLIKERRAMKSSELNRLILRNGWLIVRQTGSHVIYEKDGTRYTVPFHGGKEVGKGLEQKIKKEMGLK